MLDHVFITVDEIDRTIAFYDAALAPLGIVPGHDYDGKDGPEGHPDLKRFGRTPGYSSGFDKRLLIRDRRISALSPGARRR